MLIYIMEPYKNKYFKYKNKYNKIKFINQNGGIFNDVYNLLGVSNSILYIYTIINKQSLNEEKLDETFDLFIKLIDYYITPIYKYIPYKNDLYNINEYTSITGSKQERIKELYIKWRILVFDIYSKNLFINQNQTIYQIEYDIIDMCKYIKETNGYFDDALSRFNIKQSYDNIMNSTYSKDLYFDVNDLFIDFLQDIDDFYNILNKVNTDPSDIFNIDKSIKIAMDKYIDIYSSSEKYKDMKIENIKVITKNIYDKFIKNLKDMIDESPRLQKFIRQSSKYPNKNPNIPSIITPQLSQLPQIPPLQIPPLQIQPLQMPRPLLQRSRNISFSGQLPGPLSGPSPGSFSGLSALPIQPFDLPHTKNFVSIITDIENKLYNISNDDDLSFDMPLSLKSLPLF